MKLSFVFMMMLTVFCLTGCGEEVQQPAADLQNSEVMQEGHYWMDEDLPVSMKTERSAYRPDTETIKAVVTNRTDAEYCYSEAFTLVRMENGKETEIPYKDGGDSFTELGCICPPQGTAPFTANLGAHYNLPLEDGVYVLHVGELQAGFEISVDAAAAAEQAQNLAAEIQQADEKTLTVQVQNDADTPYEFSYSDFGLEHYQEESVSYTPYSGSAAEETVQPHDSLSLTLQTADFGGTLESGRYALLIGNCKAEFEIPADTEE